jgi:hypothetical protein
MGVEKVLAARGRAFWKKVNADFDFEPHEIEVLLEACRTLDLIDEMAASVQANGVMLVGSQGQPVLNSAVGELRQLQAAAARLITQLNLDDVEVGALQSAKQSQARAAAQKKWRDQKRAQNNG